MEAKAASIMALSNVSILYLFFFCMGYMPGPTIWWVPPTLMLMFVFYIAHLIITCAAISVWVEKWIG